MSQSYSSFSVLRDISTLMNQPKDNLKTKDGGNDEFVGASDGKSQTSLDTCESVSECMITSSEKFREEQEKTFARLVNQSLLDSFNSEKTDNMSISLNMTTSSSVSSKISGNLQTTSDCSEHSSMMSRPKTTELPTDDDIENQEECTPINVNYIMSTNNFEGCDLPYQERKEIGSSESLASGGNDQKEPFYPRRSLGQSESENTEETFQINRFSPIRSQILMHETNNIKDDKCRELCCLASDTENNEENYRLGNSLLALFLKLN